MKPTSVELTLNLAHPSLTGSETRDAARLLRLAADQIEEGGLCPGGVYGGVIPTGAGAGDRVGYWIVRAEGATEPGPEVERCWACGAPWFQCQCDRDPQGP
jgi:hypothetical protein